MIADLTDGATDARYYDSRAMRRAFFHERFVTVDGTRGLIL
jgi:hypothetical protein